MINHSDWFSLSEAAELLGVHFTTLRRWADQGLLEYVRTPGGKRKFHRQAIEAFLNRYRNPVQISSNLVQLENMAIANTRQNLHLHELSHPAWMVEMNEEQRLFFRNAGNKLIALVIQYCSRKEDGEAYLEEARDITGEYGRVCHSLGMSITECVRMFQFFRKPMLQSIHETGSKHGMGEQDGNCVFNKMSEFLDEAMLAMVTAYDQCADTSKGRTS